MLHLRSLLRFALQCFDQQLLVSYPLDSTTTRLPFCVVLIETLRKDHLLHLNLANVVQVSAIRIKTKKIGFDTNERVEKTFAKKLVANELESQI